MDARKLEGVKLYIERDCSKKNMEGTAAEISGVENRTKSQNKIYKLYRGRMNETLRRLYQILTTYNFSYSELNNYE